MAIFTSTVVMGVVCWDVYKKEHASARWRGAGAGRARNKLSAQVFWQSFWYLMAFYLTWPAYLLLQYSWAADNYFSNYGLILAAGTMVPLQGFWNFFVYIRPRQMKKATRSIRRASTRLLGRFQTTPTVSSSESATRSFMARFRASQQTSSSSRDATSKTATIRNATETATSRITPSSQTDSGANVLTEGDVNAGRGISTGMDR